MKKLLFVLLCSIGDIIQSTAIIMKFKKLGYHITYGTSKRYVYLLEGQPIIDEIKIVSDEPESPDIIEWVSRAKIDADAYIKEHGKEYDKVVFPQICFSSALHERGNKAVDTMFWLSGFENYEITPFFIHPWEDNIRKVKTWFDMMMPPNTKKIFVETSCYSKQSDFSAADMRRLVENLISDEYTFIVSGKEKEIEIFKDLPVCPNSTPILQTLALLKYINAFIGVHSGLTNLYGCEYCFNRDVPVYSIIKEDYAPYTIGPRGYPLITNMKYVFDTDVQKITDSIRRDLLQW